MATRLQLRGKGLLGTMAIAPWERRGPQVSQGQHPQRMASCLGRGPTRSGCPTRQITHRFAHTHTQTYTIAGVSWLQLAWPDPGLMSDNSLGPPLLTPRSSGPGGSLTPETLLPGPPSHSLQPPNGHPNTRCQGALFRRDSNPLGVFTSVLKHEVGSQTEKRGSSCRSRSTSEPLLQCNPCFSACCVRGAA